MQNISRPEDKFKIQILSINKRQVELTCHIKTQTLMDYLSKQLLSIEQCVIYKAPISGIEIL